MIRFCFKVMSAFWILSPVFFAIGWGYGIWDTHYDWWIGVGFSAVSTFVMVLNFEPDK